MSRLIAVFCLILLISASLASQELHEVSPQDAESHLIKIFPPVYPPWAMAQGVQGVVRLQIHVNSQGHVDFWQLSGGPSSLADAAADAVRKYVYRPFQVNGRPEAVQTSVKVRFALHGSNIPLLRPAPKFSSQDFAWFQFANPSTEFSPAMRNWLASSDLQEDSSQSGSGALDPVRVFQIRVLKTNYHLYLVTAGCLRSTNCSVEAVEEDETGVRNVFDSEGSGFYVSSREGSPYPDIFIAESMGASEIDVDGYSEAAGLWGHLYCGEFDIDSDGETEDIKLCP